MATIPQTTVQDNQDFGREGQYLPGEGDVANSFTAESDGLKPGKFVIRGTDPQTQMDIISGLTDASTATDLLGVVLLDPLMKADDAGLVDFDTGDEAAVLRRGRCIVFPEDAVTAGGQVHVRVVAAGAEVLGSVRGTADSTDTFAAALTAMRFETSAGAGEPAVISVNLA